LNYINYYTVITLLSFILHLLVLHLANPCHILCPLLGYLSIFCSCIRASPRADSSCRTSEIAMHIDPVRLVQFQNFLPCSVNTHIRENQLIRSFTAIFAHERYNWGDFLINNRITNQTFTLLVYYTSHVQCL
jgi:hypothetical protein